MALIKCPECRKKISDQCDNCPKCGYPIKTNNANTCAELNDEIATSGTEDESKKRKVKTKKPIFKRVWFWLVIVAVIAAAAIIAAMGFYLQDKEVEPKVDEKGNPVFVELTDEVYTNAEKYLGYYVVVKGKVFQSLGDNGEVKGVQVWLDPEQCEQNVMVHYTTDETIKEGDYVNCYGYIKEIHTYTNAYGTELDAPLIYSTNLQKSTYINVVAPTVSVITPENLIYKKYGYSITVNKIEFAKSETRLYLTVENNGNSTLHVNANSSVMIQDNKQFNVKTNYEADYEQLPSSLHKGTKAMGIIAFPAIQGDMTFSAIQDEEFKFKIRTYSDNSQEKLSEITFTITAGGSFCEIESDEAWKIEALFNTDEDDNETQKTTIRVGNTIYIHLKLTGGTPNEKIRVKYVITTPIGRKNTRVFDWKMSTNDEAQISMSGGIYINTEEGGVLKVEFFDADTGIKIGEETVWITG